MATRDRPADPGYDLISRGRPAFERELRYRLPMGRWLLRGFVALATPGYLGTIAVLTAVVLVIPLQLEIGRGAGDLTLVWLALLALVPASDLAIQLLNAWVMRQLGPRVLPRLALRDGVPPELRTLVAVPTLLTRAEEIEEQICRLEVHYLANPDPELRFALLSDWRDAPAETQPDDDELLAAAAARHRAPQRAARPRLPRGRRRRCGPGTRASFSSTAGGCGARASSAGWAGSASAASWRSSTGCCAGATDTTFLAATRRRRRAAGSATSSPWTPTPGCRARPRGGWSAPWPTR